MKTPRTQVYAVIDGERTYQDDLRGNSRRDHIDDQRDLGSLLVLIDQYVHKAKAAWSGPHPQGRADTLQQLRKIAALSVLAMEYHGAPSR